MNEPWKCLGAIIFSMLIVVSALLFALNWINPKQDVIPDEKTSTQLANKTTLDFALAVKSDDLSIFHSQTSPEFQARFSATDFNQTFSGFITQNVNLMAIANFAPIFSMPPAITRDGTLLLRGHYDTRPSRVVFNYDYIQSNREWKISGINIDVVPVK